MAPGWAERREWLLDVTRPVSAWLVQSADPQPGQSFLELAGGTDDLAVALARRVGDESRVVARDWSPEMVAFARETGATPSLTNVQYRALDTEQVDRPHAGVDGVVCRF